MSNLCSVHMTLTMTLRRQRRKKKMKCLLDEGDWSDTVWQLREIHRRLPEKQPDPASVCFCFQRVTAGSDDLSEICGRSENNPPKYRDSLSPRLLPSLFFSRSPRLDYAPLLWTLYGPWWKSNPVPFPVASTSFVVFLIPPLQLRDKHQSLCVISSGSLETKTLWRRMGVQWTCDEEKRSCLDEYWLYAVKKGRVTAYWMH